MAVVRAALDLFSPIGCSATYALVRFIMAVVIH
jgi:hypothetical protein